MAENGSSDIRSYVERIEERETEKRATAEDIRSIYAEAKADGINVKALREVVRLRLQLPDERAAHAAAVEEYMGALGMLATTPLGRAALRAVTRIEPSPAA